MERRASCWAEFMEEASASARAESSFTTREIMPFKNSEHKEIGIFLQDVILSGMAERACTERTAWVSVALALINTVTDICDIVEN